MKRFLLSVILAASIGVSGPAMAAANAKQLLQRMAEISVMFPHLEPSVYMYNSVMEAYTKTCNSNNPK